MITFVCGELCSGKTIYSQSLANITDGVYIEVGDIVRELMQTNDRKLLQNSKSLSKAIIKNLKQFVSKQLPKDCIISGVRQKTILKAFPDATFMWIQCPLKERKARYAKRARQGDNISFEEAEKGDKKLGILKVKKFIFKNN